MNDNTSKLTLDMIDLSDPEFWTRSQADRNDAYRVLRQQRPIAFFAEQEFPPLPQGPGYYAVTRYEDIVEISRRPDVFCSGRGAISTVDLPSEVNEFFGSLISMDGTRHARLRRIVSRTFAPRMLGMIEQDVRRIVEEIVGALAGSGPVDFVDTISGPLPLRVICDMMGIPNSDRAMVAEKTSIIMTGGDPRLIGPDANPLEALMAAGADLAGLLGELAATRARQPTDDVTSLLLNGDIDGEALSQQELVSFFILLLSAGTDTTRHAISYGVHALATRPEQRATWLADQKQVTRTAVEEIIRWASPLIFMRRTVTRDVTIGEHDFHEGDKVQLYYGSANRDETVFPEPEGFDVRRDPNPHLGFGGGGVHYCLGAMLARMELAIVFEELLRRCPGFAVAGDPVFLASNFINGIVKLPVLL